MRGIQINNYFNNHITLNGKKVDKEPHQVPATHRQKLNQPHPEDPIAHAATSDIKASPAKLTAAPLKKRTNTLVELKKHLPLKRSISVERQRNATSAKKKEELVSDSEEKEEDPLINMSLKKLKPNPSKGGLGKRSKSTIIKTHEQRELPKKDSKKLNSNHTLESTKPLKSKRKKSSKVSETARDHKQTATTKPSTAKKDTPAPSKEIFKKEKLTLKLDKNIIKTDKTEKKSARNHSKNLINPTKSKPVSAREKKANKNRFIEELKEKYENQTILEDQLGSSRLRESEDNMDNEFLSVMSSLEKILTSVGSKQKLKKELEIINEKLREFRLETEEEEGQANDTNSNKISSKVEEMGISLENEFVREEERHRHEQSEEGEEEEEEEEEPLARKMSEEDEILMRLEGEEVKNPLIGKRNHNVFFVEERPEEDDRRREIELLKKFKSESTRMMEKAGLASAAPVNTQLIDIDDHPVPQERKLTLDNISALSNNSHSSHGSKAREQWEDKYPVAAGAGRSPRFDEAQLLGAIELKEQFLSSKRDKMSELVRRMFEKQVVSPRSYEFQMKSLDRRYQHENQQLEAMRKQAEQLSSMLSEIKKDKEEIMGIDELIRNEKWEEAQRLVEKERLPAIAEKDETDRDHPDAAQQRHTHRQEHHTHKEPHRQEHHKEKEHHKGEHHREKEHHRQKQEEERPKWELSGWEKEGGWERVRIAQGEVEGNEFVQAGQLTNRGRRLAEAHLDIDEECGGTEESEELQPHEVRADHQEDEEYIYYQEDNEEESKQMDSGLIRLVQIPEDSAEESAGVFPTKEEAGVFHIKEEEGVSSSMLSAGSQAERGGFVTNLYFIKEYCIAICEFVRDNDTFKTQFRQNVSRPLQFDLPALLASLRLDDAAYPFARRTHRPAVPAVIWDEFNAQYETLKLHSASAARDSEKYKLERQLELIFVRMIYEVLNESLDHERPGGQFGRALPWRETARHLKNLRQLGGEGDNVEAYDLMFGVAIARIIQWGSCLCGFLPDTVELENTEIDDAYVNHIRETRTAFLLEKMMAEEEATMTNFELEEVEVQYRLGQLVAQELLEEAEAELARFF